MCHRCTKWNTKSFGLNYVIAKNGTLGAKARVDLKVLNRLLGNHTIRQRMGRELLRQVKYALKVKPKPPHSLAVSDSAQNGIDDDMDVEYDVETVHITHQLRRSLMIVIRMNYVRLLEQHNKAT